MQIRKFQNCGAYWLLFKLVFAKNLQLDFNTFWLNPLRSSKILSNANVPLSNQSISKILRIKNKTLQVMISAIWMCVKTLIFLFKISNLYVVILKAPIFSCLILKQFFIATEIFPFNRDCHRTIAVKKKKKS